MHVAVGDVLRLTDEWTEAHNITGPIISRLDSTIEEKQGALGVIRV